ncbi:MAG: M23 family metallopeptidase [Bacteroidota bacterium]|jgi:murein DD-endopeptidase MepM/ murein hydrolase activator NlpD
MKINFKKVKWVYNPHKLHFEPVTISIRKRLMQALGFLSSSFVMGVIFFFVFESFVDSPEEKSLKQENAFLSEQLDEVNNQISQIESKMTDIHDKDNQLYRAFYEKDPIEENKFNAGKGGNDYYKDLRGFDRSDLVIELNKKIDKLNNQVKLQSSSFDELLKAASQKADLLASIPAVQPVANKDLRMIASGFGSRIDPIYKTWKMHSGIDFTAPMGKEIHATGNGVVQIAGMEGDGYGVKVVINHGFGYQTLYGHMMRTAVRPGQKIKRGDVIGYVGSTGKSTGPHVHYEIIKNGQKINPINYFYNDISASEYDKMVQIAERGSQSFD